MKKPMLVPLLPFEHGLKADFPGLMTKHLQRMPHDEVKTLVGEAKEADIQAKPSTGLTTVLTTGNSTTSLYSKKRYSLVLKERPVSLIWDFEPNIACPV